MKKYLKKQTGFSLVEMVATLLVVGILILGGIKGLELYKNAQLYQLKSEFEEFESMVNSYFVKHGRLPAAPSVPITAGSWQAQFWQDLRVEGLIKDGVIDGRLPRHAFGEPDTVWLAQRTGAPASNGLFIRSLILCATKVNAVHAQAIDRQFDDGNGKTGRIKSVIQGSILNADGTAKAALWQYLRQDKLIDYSDNSGQEWNVTICQKVAKWK